jgi:predicted transcriptional regulator
MTNISLGILLALNEHKQIEGTDKLAELVNAKQKDVTRNALILIKWGMIHCIPGTRGRGHKTIYRDAGVIKVQR